MNILGVDIVRNCHASIKLKADGKVIYIDPYKLPEGSEKADVILITHEHEDHLSLPDIENIFQDSTTIVINPVTHPPLLQFDHDIPNLVVIGPGETYRGEGWTVATVPAYNIDKFRESGRPYHPREDERFGVVVTLAGTRIYHAGDTDAIPEMEGLDVDIACLPVSGTFVMTAEEAARAVQLIKPKVAIPIHYGDIVGTQEDAETFKRQAGTQVEIL